ncbi:hypothetical protein [Roseivirga pacifica]|uniref:hypothetical protein n=1 Tax=Roseivirga pacifica TaxID=1267423 RepID=UPI003BAFA8B6
MKIKVENLTFQERFFKRFLSTSVIIIFLITISYLFSPSSNSSILVLILTGSLISLAITLFISTRTYIYEVHIESNNLVLKGDKTNQSFEVHLPISETIIEIKSKGRGRGKVGYYLDFRYQKEDYQINRLFNWHYSRVLEVFYAFKKAKDEKIIFDEKYYLEIMEKKAQGKSDFLIVNGGKK